MLHHDHLYPGLCGDFDNDGSQDFKTTSGIIEKTAWTFANTWKTKSNCPDVTNILGDPCSLSTEKGRSQSSCSMFC